MIDIINITEPYKNKTPILAELYSTLTEDLVELVNAIEAALDFTDSDKRGRPAIRFGLDEELDKSKMNRP